MSEEEDYGDLMAEDDLFEKQEDNKHIAESLSKALDELQDDTNIEMFSDLSMREIKIIAPLLTTKGKTSGTLVKWYLKTNVSRRRKGRKEIIDAMKSIGGLTNQEEPSGRLQRFKEQIL